MKKQKLWSLVASAALALLPFATIVPAAHADTSFANGDLVQANGDDKMYVIDSGHRRWIADTASLQALNPDFSRLKHISFDQLDAIPPGKPYRQGPVIRDPASGRVYILTQETNWAVPHRHWVSNIDSFTKLGLDWSDVSADWPTPPDRYPDAPALIYRPLALTAAALNTTYGSLQVIPAWQIQAEDERLYDALAIAYTYNSAWRSVVAPKLAAQGTWFGWGPLPSQVGGLTQPSLNRVTIATVEQQQSMGIVAATVSHEAFHAITQHGTTPQSCYDEEANAFALEAQTWLGMPATLRGTSSEVQFENDLAALFQSGGVAAIAVRVAASTAYQRQCSGYNQIIDDQPAGVRLLFDVSP